MDTFNLVSHDTDLEVPINFREEFGDTRVFLLKMLARFATAFQCGSGSILSPYAISIADTPPRKGPRCRRKIHDSRIAFIKSRQPIQYMLGKIPF